MADTNTKLGTKAGLTLADGSTYNISIGQNSGPLTKKVYTKRLWIDILQTDRPLIGGNFGVPRSVDIWGDLNVHGAANFLMPSVGSDVVYDNVLINERIGFDSVYDNGNSGSSKVIDCSNGNNQKLTMTANCVISFTNPAIGSLTLFIFQGGSGGYSITYPSSSIWWWAGRDIPSLSPNIGNCDILCTRWDGTRYYATMLNDFGPGV